uniref:Uncharacterized protein n=1 Tax=Anguilla anguilla TaxID=7936 RepID=A0A0E9RPU1_ANGAN
MMQALDLCIRLKNTHFTVYHIKHLFFFLTFSCSPLQNSGHRYSLLSM